MTDDKGAGEGPYKIMLNDGRITAVSGPNGCWGTLEGDDLAMVLNDAHAEGRKAERDKNWKTVAELCGVNPHTHRPCIEKVEEKFRCPICVCAGKIRGGQDGE